MPLIGYQIMKQTWIKSTQEEFFHTFRPFKYRNVDVPLIDDIQFRIG